MVPRARFSAPVVNSVCRPLDLEESWYAIRLEQHQQYCTSCRIIGGVLCSQAIIYIKRLRDCVFRDETSPDTTQLECPYSFYIIQAILFQRVNVYEENYDKYSRPLRRRSLRYRVLLILK